MPIIGKERIKGMLPGPVVAYFTTGASRSIKVKKNIALSLLIRCANIAISFLLVPLTINYVNPTQYGIWITLSSIIAWFSFFDIGFGNGLRNKFAEAVALGKHKLARVYVSTTYAVLALIIGVVLLLFLIAHNFINWSTVLNSPQDMGSELSTLILVVFVFFTLQFVLQLINVVVTANHEPAKGSFTKLISNLLALSIIFILTQVSHGNLLLLGLALGATPIIAMSITSWWLYTHEYRKYAPTLSLVNLKFARNLMNLGIRFFLIQASGIILYSTDNFIITHLFGPADVTPYSVAFKYFSITTIIYGIILAPLWSATTDAIVKDDFEWIRRAIRKAIQICLILLLVLLAMVIFAKPAYRLWVGEQVTVASTLSLLTAIYYGIILVSQPFTFFLNGTGKIQIQLIQSIVTALIHIPLAVWLASIPSLGINGIVLAAIISALPGLVLSIMQYNRLISKTAIGIWNQ